MNCSVQHASHRDNLASVRSAEGLCTHDLHSVLRVMEDEDDYLSDKFLAEAPPIQQPKTYADRRRQALAHSRSKNDQNRTKSRRQRELQSREEGLSKSLFEKAAEEEALRGGAANKALAMMMKMGFKPGQSLGRVDDAAGGTSEPSDLGIPMAASDRESSSKANDSSPQKNALQQRIEPLPVNEWAGMDIISMRNVNYVLKALHRQEGYRVGQTCGLAK